MVKIDDDFEGFPRRSLEGEGVEAGLAVGISELITRIKELEDKYEKQLLKHEIEMQQEKHKNELLNKDLEIMKLQLEIKNKFN